MMAADLAFVSFASQPELDVRVGQSVVIHGNQMTALDEYYINNGAPQL